jgi:uncharacterized membrane protein
VLVGIAAALAVLTLAGILLLRPTGGDRPDLSTLGFAGEFFGAEVVAASEVPCQGVVEEEVTCRDVAFELREGPDRGRVVTQNIVDTPALPDIDLGDQVVLRFDPRAQGEAEYAFADLQRRPTLIWLALLFAAAVVALGRLRGLAALAGLGGSLLILVTFILPAILDGRHPLMVAIVGASAIAFLALYVAHGFTTMTTVALLGTLGSLALTAVLAEVFVTLARISGFASEEATIVRVGAAEIDLAGIVLGGVVIGALGAIDDMTVTQASAVWELRAANPRMGRRSLVRSGLRIGRDHVASTVNTLALAYAGASMPLLLLFVLSRQSFGTIANGEVVATEIVRALVGSIGLVAAVPITTWLASIASPRAEGELGPRSMRRRPEPEPFDDDAVL